MACAASTAPPAHKVLTIDESGFISEHSDGDFSYFALTIPRFERILPKPAATTKLRLTEINDQLPKTAGIVKD
jgi:hypothetical protein